MSISSTQSSSDNRLNAIHYQGQITMREDGVHFSCAKLILCRIYDDIIFEGLKHKVGLKAQVIGGNHDFTSIAYRKSNHGDYGCISLSSMRNKTYDEVQSMLNIHNMLQKRNPLELYIETQRSVNEIIRYLYAGGSRV